MRPLYAFVIVFSALVSCGGELPAVIRDEITTTSRVERGAATVVFFADFQCPYCRNTHALLAPLLQARRGRYRVVVRHVPLPRHPDARGAARAAICVETVNADPGYADALFQSADLSEAACETLAVQRGVDRDRFRRCLGDPATNVRLDHDLAMFDAVKGEGVPLLYIGRTRIEGEASARSLQSALDDALNER